MSRPARGVRAKRRAAPPARRKLKAKLQSDAKPMVEAGPVNAVIADGTDDSRALLSEVLERAGLWPHLAQIAAAAGLSAGDIRIVIKPEMVAFAHSSPTATEPLLVEVFVDLLHDAGYANVMLAAARDSSALWADNRDVLVLADLLGYRFVTPGGRAYDIADLGEDLRPSPFAEGMVLHGSPLSRSWTDAHVRIVFSKNRTDESNVYALCLDTLLGVLPLEDKDYYYRHRFDAGEVAVALLRAAPVHFALIDAFVSAHGSAGRRAPLRIETRTVIASRNLLLADYAGAAKMGIDPYASPVNARCLRDLGLPAVFRIDGNLAPYHDWRNVHPFVADSTRRRDAWASVSRTVKPWLQVLDRELFPLKHPLNERLNGALAPRLANPDADPLAFWLMVSANYYVSGTYGSLEAYRTLFDKDRLRRREAALGLDLAQFSPVNYERIADELLPIASLVESLVPDETGLRWRYLDESIAFEYARVIPIPFEEFTAKVDISRTIQFMNDYIGGVAVPVARDGSGRVTHQAERNLYLPQPNYIVLYQGDVIDVTKLEHATYGADQQRMFWKTIKSENGSARFDDGIVTFSRDGVDTRVSIVGRQLFTLPLFWQAVNLDLAPELKGALVTHAYTTFFRRTLANLEAVAEGRDIRIGRPWHDPAVAPGTEPFPIDRATERLAALKHQFGADWLRDLGRLLRFEPTKATPIAIDADGFRHFRAPSPEHAAGSSAPAGAVSASVKSGMRELFELWRDLVEAIRKDARMTSVSDRP